eukprot:gnl/TRDRNA2_/TRDRNA2_207348_c0_seq1.p1 gnl/TRDRNA2_/TRDRNA2_207348_c0~~gnl/TRDRNA2_/TRDRNA2_207348_c0_seq1.p1  ORF type:complete len:497 (+),score=43.74 gnl/TRDRNA2_/TRDRNA2_207348_c0_seq1:37-1491(+)
MSTESSNSPAVPDAAASAPRKRAASPAARSTTASAAAPAVDHGRQEKSAGGVPDKWPNWQPHCRLCFGFFLIFTAFNTTQNMSPHLLAEVGLGHLGFVSVTIIYVCFGAACVPMPVVMRQAPPRAIIPWAAAAYPVYVISVAFAAASGHNLALGYTALLLSAAVVGFSAAALWCCQGHILTHYAPPTLLNKYVALFTLCFALSGLAGPVAAKVLLAHMSIPVLFVFLCATAGVGGILLAKLPSPDPFGGAPKEAAVVVKPWPEVAAEIRIAFAKPLSLIASDGCAVRVAALGFADGLGINVSPSAVLSRVVMASSTSELGRGRAAQALACMGAGHVLTSLAFAPAADLFGRRAVLGSSLGFYVLAAVLCLISLGDEPSAAFTVNVLCAQAAAFFLGTANIICRAALTALVGSLYQREPARGSALSRLCSSTGAVAGLLILPRVSLLGTIAIFFAAQLAAIAFAVQHAPLFGTASSVSTKNGKAS